MRCFYRLIWVAYIERLGRHIWRKFTERIHSSKYIQLGYIYRPNWHSTESHRSQLKSLKTTPKHTHNLDQNEGDKNDRRLGQHDKKLNYCLRLITIRAARIRLLRHRNWPRLAKAGNQKLNVSRRFINFWITLQTQPVHCPTEARTEQKKTERNVFFDVCLRGCYNIVSANVFKTDNFAITISRLTPGILDLILFRAFARSW